MTSSRGRAAVSPSHRSFVKRRSARLRGSVLALSLALSAALGACASLVREPSVALSQVELRGIGLAGATVRVELDVVNPNRFGLESKALDYILSYAASPGVGTGPEAREWRLLAEGRTAEAVELPSRDTARVTLDVPFQYRDVGPALLALLREGTLEYRFEGAFSVGSPVGTLRVPFDRIGRLDR